MDDEARRKRGLIRTALIVGAAAAVLAAVAALLVKTHHRPPMIAAAAPPTAHEMAVKAQAAQRARPHTVLSLEQVQGTKSQDGGRLMLAGTLINSGGFDVKDAKIRCMLTTTDYRQAGQLTGTLDAVVPAKGKAPFSKLDMGPLGDEMVAHCSVIDAEQAP